ncbi:hypothetical protein K2X40_05610 [Candidatus Babeliales bacterium]|nr:hypothetical protein [Candidatus Babeliales bacterium]
MVKKAFVRFFFVFVCAATFSKAFAAAPTPAPTPATLPFFATFKERVSNGLSDPKKFVTQNSALFGLLRCAAHVPYIVCVDHEDTNVVRATTAVANVATDAKILCELLTTRETTLLKDLVYPNRLPKVSAYMLALLYEAIRIVDAENVAFKNKYGNAKKKLRMFKVAQSLQVAIEASLRLLSYASSVRTPHDTSFAFWLLELADFVEVWRLLARYKTFFDISGVQANINFFAQISAEEEEECLEDSADQEASNEKDSDKSDTFDEIDCCDPFEEPVGISIEELLNDTSFEK